MLRPVNGSAQVKLEPLVANSTKGAETAKLENLKAYASHPNGLVQSLANTGESVDVSVEGREKLSQLREAEFYAKQSEPEDVSARLSKIEQFKALAATGKISEYLNQLDTRSIADSVLGHPLKPSLI